MIENKHTKPTYTPRGQRALDAEIASKQVAKAASAEVVALSASDTANFVLRKATQNLEDAKVAYFSAVEKSAWNLDVLKDAYNNALAGFRDAEKATQFTAGEVAKAKMVLSGLRKKAKMDDDASDEDYSDDDSSEYDDEFAKSLASSHRATAVTAQEEAAADAMAGVDPTGTSKLLNDLAEMHEQLSGMARQTGNLEAHSAHAAEAGRLRAKSISIRAMGTNKETLKSAFDFLGATTPTFEQRIHNKEVSKSVMLICCPSCMGDGCDGCDDGSIYSSNLDQHLGDVVDSGDYSMPIAMSAFTTSSLLTRNFEKSASYQEYVLAKGDELGHPYHGNQYGEGSSAGIAQVQSERRAVSIPARQVPQKRDPNWNPRTSGPLVNMPLVGMQRGFNDIIRDYKASFNEKIALSAQATADAKDAVAKGDLETAANKAQEAVDALNAAVKSARGVFFTHEKFDGKIKQADISETSAAMGFRKMARDIVDNKIPVAEEFANQIIAAYKQSEAAKLAAIKIVGL